MTYKEYFKHKKILITGGTGSFGKAFVKYLIKNEIKPDLLTVYSRDWQKQSQMKNEIGKCSCLDFVIGDIRDEERLRGIISDVSYNIIIHAAAIKCIEACENNANECLKTNVIGTQNVINAIKGSKTISSAIFISTDKAVLPINTYGTSKKMAEKLWINAYSWQTDFIICRYGNVVGSNGSVLPLYLKLINDGVKSLPVTDERMTRFWFEMKDAIEFVINSIISPNGEGVQIPKIPSIKITDLCHAFNMPYEVIGIREGEKLHEYMIPPDEITDYKGYSSYNNPKFLTVEEIRRSIDEFKNTNT